MEPNKSLSFGSMDDISFSGDRHRSHRVNNQLERFIRLEDENYNDIMDLPISTWKHTGLKESKNKLGGSVDSILSQTSVQNPGWMAVKPSKSQDALVSPSHSIKYQMWPSKENVLESSEIDDVVGDEINFKSRRQLQKETTEEYEGTSFTASPSLSHSALEAATLPEQSRSEGEQLQNYLQEMEAYHQWTKATGPDLEGSEETKPNHFQSTRFNKERKEHDVFDSFDPSSPTVLQRQIGNLKNQINDLQEANESAVLELSKADEEICQQRKDLAKLKAEYHQKLEDSQEQIKILTEKITLASSRLPQPENYQEGLQKEIIQLRGECRRLRTESHLVGEENYRLKEDLWDLRMQRDSLLTRDEQNFKSEWVPNKWTSSSDKKLQGDSWSSEENSLYRNEAFKVDGTFSKCKAASGSVIIKEPWERNLEEHFTRNTSPYSMYSENTDILVQGYQDGQGKTLHANVNGGGHEGIQEMREDGLCSTSHIQDNVISQSQQYGNNDYSPFSKTVNNKRQHVSVLPRRPFAPKSAADLKLGDLVKFSHQGGKISKGTVQYRGPLPGREEVYLGVELEGGDLGKHDGVFQGTRYFLCKPNKGAFVNFSKIIMAWS
ncbi:uncharacterized protein LOC120926512 isoform X2 [Rana temporaria]|uniref:uncharacterized protein LOC120926512 isoform X2 n=1 Tax=Rana temporaria TaxID=8407 RepID=UPI001AACAA71|nr:uncharacterized protein LOC120926512 isoform X2 [Rana temporaria]